MCVLQLEHLVASQCTLVFFGSREGERKTSMWVVFGQDSDSFVSCRRASKMDIFKTEVAANCVEV